MPEYILVMFFFKFMCVFIALFWHV